MHRVFERDRRDQLWVTDITAHRIREGKVYCAVVLDAYSRRVVTKELVRRVRDEDPSQSPEARVLRAAASGQASVGPPPVQRRHSAPIRNGDQIAGMIDTDYDVIANTALSILRPRVAEISREAAAAMLQQFCEETNFGQSA